MNLYELKGAYANIQELIEQGEILDDVLDTITDAIHDKADGYAKVMCNINANIDVIKAEETRLANRRKAMQSHVDRLKEDLYNAMIDCDEKKFKTELFSFSIQKNGGKAPIILNVECDKLPDDLVTVTEKPNLEAIAEYIKKTGDMTYAYIGERGESLRIK